MTKGKLIALEGAWGPSVAGAAEELLRRATDGVQPGKISEWDASGIFGELRLSEPGMARPSPRTLVLLYAADLAFRLRREILPALEEGRCVVAAPYVQSAIAFGTAAGLPRRWLVDLFRFAPEPQERYRLRESRREGLGQISGWPPTDRSIRSTAGSSPGPTPSPQPRAGSPD
jgi:thymidylate kinase